MPRPRARAAIYALAVIMASASILLVSQEFEGRVSEVVLAVATLALAGVGIEAVIYNRELVSAAREEAAAARDEAKATLAAVDATRESTSEARRQALLASAPFLRMGRPTPEDCDTGLVVRVPVTNLGPGHALEAALQIEPRYRGSTEFASSLTRTGWAVAVVAMNEEAVPVVAMQDYRNMDVPRWNRHAPDGAGGWIDTKPPVDLLLPEVIRIRLRWMSTLGAGVEQSYLWELRDFSAVEPVAADAWSWRFEYLTITPGPGHEPVVVSRPAD